MYALCQPEYFFHDPLVARINVVTATFRWSATDEHCGGGWYNLLAYPDPKGAQLAHESREFGRKVGLAVPIHGRHGPIAAVSIATDHYDLSPRDERVLQMASLYLHAQLKELRTEALPRPVHNLTPRERECLQWVAAGKTDWEISQILNISEQTAHGYVQNALTKLNARTRAQAVALAMQTAQILP